MISLSFGIALARSFNPPPLCAVPIDTSEDTVLVRAVVNGEPVRLIFDTGFSGAVVIDQSVNVGEPTGHRRLRDFVENFDAPTVPLKSMSIGGADIPCKGEEIVLQPLGVLATAYGVKIDGVMGLDAIKSFVTEINFEQSSLRLYPKSFDIGQLKSDGHRTFSAKLLPIGHSTLPLAVEVGDDRLSMSLDTGNVFYATTHRDVLERLGLWTTDREPKYTRPTGVASGKILTWSVRMDRAKIFGVPVEHSIWDVIELPSSAAESDGTVGFQFLRNFNIVFDLDRRLVWLDNFAGSAVVEPRGEVGMDAGFIRAEGHVLVLAVVAGGPADQAGVRANDEVLSVDGISMRPENVRRLRRLLQGPIGSTVKIDLSRDGEIMHLELVRRLLVNELNTR
jgi:predicted aspartyl protease